MFFPLVIHYGFENTNLAFSHPLNSILEFIIKLLLQSQEDTEECDLCSKDEHELGENQDRA